MNWRFWKKKTPEMRFAEKIAKTVKEIPRYLLPKRVQGRALEVKMALLSSHAGGSFEPLYQAVKNFIAEEDTKTETGQKLMSGESGLNASGIEISISQKEDPL